MPSQKITKFQDSISAEHKGGDLTESNTMRSGGGNIIQTALSWCVHVCEVGGGEVLPDSSHSEKSSLGVQQG